LREHEPSKLSPGKRSRPVEYGSVKVFFEREFSQLIGVPCQLMAILNLGSLQLEVRRRPLAGMTIPPVGKKHAADIQEQTGR
jgi:hypothetical protein